MKIDVAIQSYKKPESLIYTLLSLKKYCSELIDTIYINDDKSGGNVIEMYKDEELQKIMFPIKIMIRENIVPSGYTHTLLTKEVFKGKNIIQKIQLLLSCLVKRAKFYSSTDEIRYQWAMNNTDKKYLFITHDDMKFNADIIKLYVDKMEENENLAIVGDLGGSPRCPYGPCGDGNCGALKILKGYRPSKKWPITGKSKSLIHTILGRKPRYCRINEWCCVVRVSAAREIAKKYGAFFGNYEFGGDVATYWFEKMIKMGYDFYDPLDPKQRVKYYQHCWQGHAGHQVWLKEAAYKNDFIEKCIKDEFAYTLVKKNETK